MVRLRLKLDVWKFFLPFSLFCMFEIFQNSEKSKHGLCMENMQGKINLCIRSSRNRKPKFQDLLDLFP